MTVLNKYITNVLFLGLFLFASCEDKIEKKEKIFLTLIPQHFDLTLFISS